MAKENRTKLLSLDFVLIVAVCGLGRIGNHMQSVTIPLYMQSIGYTATMAGLMTTIYTIASLVLRPFIGVLLDRKGRWLIATAGTALFALVSASFPFIRAFGLLVFVRILHGIGFSAHATAINTMGTDVLPESRLSEGIGYMGLTNSLSTAVAPALAFLLKERCGYNETFYTIFFITACAALLCFGIRYEKRSPRTHVSEKVTWGSLFEKESMLPSVLIMIMAGANIALGTFLATYTGAMGIEGTGLFFTVNAVAMAVARLFGGRLTSIVGEKRMMFIGMALCFAGYLAIFVTRGQATLLLGATVYGLGYGIVYPLLNAMAVVQTPAARRGAANATFLMMMDIGIGLGAMVWGLTIDWFGVRWLYLLCALTVVLGTALLAWMLCRKEESKRLNDISSDGRI